MPIFDSVSSSWLARYFYQRSLRTRVFLTQLPLAIVVAMLCLLSAIFNPLTFADPRFVAALAMLALLLAASYLVPWDRLPYPSFLVIPYLDFIAIALGRECSADTLSGVGLLVLFPVFWLSASGLARITAIVASFGGTLLVVWMPLLLGASGPLGTGAVPAAELVLPVMMLAFSVTVVVMTTSMEAQRQELERTDRLLNDALRASESRGQLLDAIVDTVNVGLVAVDAEGHDILLNRKQRQFHQLATPPHNADPSERQLLIYGPDKTTPMVPEQRPVHRAVHGESFSEQLIWLGRGVKAKAVSATARPIKSADGSAAGSVVAFYDVTELVEALAAKDDFVSSISHEFRTPLTSILGYIGLALEEEDVTLSIEVAQYLKVAERNADRLLTLVSDLLTTASRTLDIHPRRTDLAELVELSLDSAAPRAEENSVILVNDTPGPLMAQLDVGRIGQVLDNLISNAVKYSPDGGTVTVRGRRVGGNVVCEVADTGIGMDESEKAEAFTKFFRAGAARNRAIPGIGLGLVITKTIIENHGGSIEMESEPGAGTTMRFTIPLEGAPPEAAVLSEGSPAGVSLPSTG